MAPKKRDRERVLSLLKALADDTRYEILVLIGDSSSPVSAQQVADALQLHPNTVRPHLERLRDAGFLELVVSSDGRVGRPQHLYQVSPEAPSLGVDPGSYRAVSEIMHGTLAEMIEKMNVSAESATDIGRSWGQNLRRNAASDAAVIRRNSSICGAAAELVDDLNRLGFDPIESGSDVVFTSCPFRELAEAYPEVVCSAHRGICEGSLDAQGDGVEIAAFNSIDSGEPCLVTLAT